VSRSVIIDTRDSLRAAHDRVGLRLAVADDDLTRGARAPSSGESAASAPASFLVASFGATYPADTGSEVCSMAQPARALPEEPVSEPSGALHGAPLEAPDPGVAFLGEVAGSIPAGAHPSLPVERRQAGAPRRPSLVDLFRSVLIKAAGLPVDTQTIFHLAYEVDDALDHRYGADPDKVFAALCAALAVPGVRDLEEVKALGWDLAQEGRLGIHPGR
jgi:hypothetical protein